MTQRAILYARVSTDEQADRGHSLPSQLESCRAYAELRGFEIVKWFSEDYSGATPIAERPEGKKLVSMLAAKQADAVIAYCVDRLSRDNIALQIAVRDWVRAGIEVHTVEDGRIKDERQILLLIKGWMGEAEREKIVERTSRGRNMKARNGKPVGTGFAPYAFAKVYDVPPPPQKPKVIAFEVIKTEAEVVERIFKWYARGDNAGRVSVHEMCRRLQSEGIPIPSENHFHSKRSGAWSPTIIYKILRNELYLGTWHYGKSIGEGGRQGRRPKSEQIAVSVPQIISRELFDAAQAKLKYNVLMSKRRAKHEYLLRSMVKCSCGHTMIGRFRADVHTPDPRYYKCSTETQTWKERQCGQKRISASETETKVWNYVDALMRDVMQYEDLLHQAQQEELNAIEPKREELEGLEKQLADCDNEVARTAKALVRATGAVSLELEKQMREVNERHAQLSKRREEVTAQIETRSLTDGAVDAALHFREDVVRGLDNPTAELKRWFLETLGTRVEVRDSKLWVKLRVECQSPLGCQTF